MHDCQQAALILQNADVGQPIAVDQQKVREKAFFDLPEFVPHRHDLTTQPGRRLDRFHRREVEVVDEMLEIARIGADRVPGEAVVAARQYAYAAFLQILHVLDRDLELTAQAEIRRDVQGAASGSPSSP